MTLHERLRQLADALPPRGSVTFSREDLLELLAEAGAVPVETAGAAALADYTVEDLARIIGKRPQTVRDWIRSGALEAYRFRGRQYRITRAAWDRFVVAEREREQEGKPRTPRGQPKPVDLGSWRRRRSAAN